jgi:hypothetical protein
MLVLVRIFPRGTPIFCQGWGQLWLIVNEREKIVYAWYQTCRKFQNNTHGTKNVTVAWITVWSAYQKLSNVVGHAGSDHQ